MIALFAFFLDETYSETLLARKTARLRKETGNPALRSKLDSGLAVRDAFKLAISRPLKMLFLSPIVLIMSVVMAITYSYVYLLFTTITEVFEGQYGFGDGIVGLTYLGIGIGMFAGVVIFGIASDKHMKSIKAAGKEMRPEDRLPLLVPGSFCVPIGLLIYGWSARYNVFWFVPIFGTAFVGIGNMGTIVSCTGPLPLWTTLTRSVYRCPARPTSSTPSRCTPRAPSRPRPSCAPSSARCCPSPARPCTRRWDWGGETRCWPLSRWRLCLSRF